MPVGDEDAAISFYTGMLGFELVADVPFGDGERWVEVAPPGGGAALALVPSRGEYEAGAAHRHRTRHQDAGAVHEELKAKGVDVDAETMGGKRRDGAAAVLLRDHDANTLMVVESA